LIARVNKQLVGWSKTILVKFKGNPDTGNPHVRFDEGEDSALSSHRT